MHIGFSYTAEQYQRDIDTYGLSVVWDYILDNIAVLSKRYHLFNLNNLGELYEIGLAHFNKTDKKECGKYYTPADVANVMADFLTDVGGECVCDVCCGTGNLILSYLCFVGEAEAIFLLSSGLVYLYDSDELALRICKAILSLRYGAVCADKVHYICGDFLDGSISLPADCKVISNPPYFRIDTIPDSWDYQDVARQSKEIYAAMMEKILKQSSASVIITPYSFIGGKKFSSLRKILSPHSGYIFSFDNVPGNVFNGRKHGIFNSNTSNSVRAAITVTYSRHTLNGYLISPLIRFKNSERDRLFRKACLRETLPFVPQTAFNGEMFYKCHNDLERVFLRWRANTAKLGDIVVGESDYRLCIPNSCRYRTTATVRDLQRTGKYYLYFKNEEDMLLAHSFLNSSFAYWHWRLYDGGITYPKSLLLSLPIFFDALSNTQKETLMAISRDIIAKESTLLSYKKNAGAEQENVKIDIQEIEKINKLWCNALHFKEVQFDTIHKNSFFE